MKRFIPIIAIIVFVCSVFSPWMLRGTLPIPADTIVGLYHPFLDKYASTNPRGVPFKNPLITDPVRQQYPWKNLALILEKQLQLPLWNPYQMSGVPLLGNFQSSVFYPLNILLVILPFSVGWSLLIFLQPLLAGIWMYLYLRNLKLEWSSSLLGSFVFSFCGFSVSWMEWGTIVQTALWLPLILLAIDKIFESTASKKKSKFTFQIFHAFLSSHTSLILWSFVYLFSFVASFFAGHVQTFIYLLILSSAYFHISWWRRGKNWQTYFWFTILHVVFLLITAIQWLPTLQFLLVSARDVDLINNWKQPGWFIPWNQLVQFIAPDFFGNPATGNYWGVWNYGEFIGYVSIAPLILAVLSMVFRRDKKVWFFSGFLLLSLLFALPTGISALPNILRIPFLSTAQPTRLLFIIDFCLAVLSALGLDYLLKTKKKETLYYGVGIMAFLFLASWLVVIVKIGFGNSTDALTNISVAKRNLVLPTIIFIVSSGLLTFAVIKKIQKFQVFFLIGIIVLIGFDLFRFAGKYESFSPSEYLFPQTKTISFLQQNLGNYRVMETDPRIMAPNFTMQYQLQSIDGYDPLYLKNYGELIAAMQRGKPDISSPFGFNRIIQPTSYQSPLINLLGVKYILSLDELHAPNLTQVMEEGQTKVYENKEVLPRAFFVKQVVYANGKQDEIAKLFSVMNYRQYATQDVGFSGKNSDAPLSTGTARIVSYTANRIIIATQNTGLGFLVLTDAFYPAWKATIDGKNEPVNKVDYTFRGVYVPAGNHTVVFYDTLL